MRAIVAASLVIALMLVGNRLAFAQSPQQYYSGPGGQITGYVIGVSGYPVDWALICASDGQNTFQVFSGMSGVYLMRVPVGTYNVTVHVSGYRADSVSVNVADGSSVTVNFHLKQSQVAVPEFQPNITPIVMALALAAALIIRRSPKR